MVLLLLTLAAIPSVTGVSQGVSAQRNDNARKKDAKRMKKFNIDICCTEQNLRDGEVHERRMLLKDDRVWIGSKRCTNPSEAGYVAEAFYIEYPDKERVPIEMGLVSQVQDDPPLLNWIYVDRMTMELKYGNKTASIDHCVGSWDWTRNERYVTLDGNENFMAVEDPVAHKWQIYYDVENNGLEGFLPTNRRRQRVALMRNLIGEM